MDAKAVIQQQQATVQQAENQKKQLLTVSKESESAYGDLVTQKAQKAAKSALPSLTSPVRVPSHLETL